MHPMRTMPGTSLSCGCGRLLSASLHKEDPMPEDRQSLIDARIGELLRLQVLLDGPRFAVGEIRDYIAERLEAIYPLDYHVYRRRWEQLASGAVSGDANWPRLNYLEWRQALDALAEEMRLAEMLGEGESSKAVEWRSLLMAGPEWDGQKD